MTIERCVDQKCAVAERFRPVDGPCQLEDLFGTKAIPGPCIQYLPAEPPLAVDAAYARYPKELDTPLCNDCGLRRNPTSFDREYCTCAQPSVEGCDRCVHHGKCASEWVVRDADCDSFEAQPTEPPCEHLDIDLGGSGDSIVGKCVDCPAEFRVLPAAQWAAVTALVEKWGEMADVLNNPASCVAYTVCADELDKALRKAADGEGEE